MMLYQKHVDCFWSETYHISHGKNPTKKNTATGLTFRFRKSLALVTLRNLRFDHFVRQWNVEIPKSVNVHLEEVINGRLRSRTPRHFNKDAQLHRASELFNQDWNHPSHRNMSIKTTQRLEFLTFNASNKNYMAEKKSKGQPIPPTKLTKTTWRRPFLFSTFSVGRFPSTHLRSCDSWTTPISFLEKLVNWDSCVWKGWVGKWWWFQWWFTFPKTNECPLFKGTISIGNASWKTIDFQGTC